MLAGMVALGNIAAENNSKRAEQRDDEENENYRIQRKASEKKAQREREENGRGFVVGEKFIGGKWK